MDSTEHMFVFTAVTVGLPDHIYIDPETSKPREAILRKSAGISNRIHSNKALNFTKSFDKVIPSWSVSDGKSKLLDRYANPIVRRFLFHNAIETNVEELKQGGEFNQLQCMAPSWDMEVFVHYAPEVFEDRSTYEIEVSVENGFDSAVLGICDAWGEDCKVGMQIAYAVKRKLYEDILNWDDFDENKRKEISSVTLCVATQVNPEVFNKIIDLQPNIKNYFQVMISLPFNSIMSEDAGIEGDCEDKYSDIKGPTTEPEWLAAIQTLLHLVKNNPGDLTARENFVGSVNEYALWLEDGAWKADAVEHQNRFVDYLIELGKQGHIELFEQAENDHVVTIFKALWNQAFSSEEMLAMHDKDLVVLVEVLQARLYALETERRDAQADLDKYATESQCINEKFLDKPSLAVRRRLERDKAEIDTSLAQAKLQVYAAEDALLLALMPEGAKLEQLEELIEPETLVASEDWPSELQANALRTFYLWQGENLVDIDGEAPPLEIVTDETTTALNDDTVFDVDVVDSDIDDTQVEDLNALIEENEDTSDSLIDAVEVEPAAEALGFSETEVEPETAEPESKEVEVILPEVQETVEYEVDIDQPPAPTAEVKPTTVKSDEQTAQSEEGQVCLDILAREAFIPGDILNSALTRLVKDQQLPMAAQLAYAADKRGVTDGILPFNLFKAAYYGMHTFDDRMAFNKARQQLLTIQNGDYERWQNLLHSEIAPYLMFMATFQPAMFGGNASTAIILLRDISDALFDDNTKSLIKDIIVLANRNERATLSLLRAGGRQSAEPKVFDDTSLHYWAQKIREARRGYAPILKSLSYCLERGVLGEIANILLENDRHQIPRVESFIAEYEDQEAATALLNDTLAQINLATGESITRVGKQRFQHKVIELVNIAKDWLESQSLNKGTALDDFCKRFSTRLKQSISHFERAAAEAADTCGRQAGAALVAQSLNVLYRSVTQNSVPWDYARVKGWYYYPREIVSTILPQQDDTSPEVISWLLANIGGGVCNREHLDTAIHHGCIRLAELLRLHLMDKGVSVDDVDTHEQFQELKRSLAARCSQLEGQLENALLGGLMDAARVEFLNAQISDALESIDVLEVLDDSKVLNTQLQMIEQELQERTASTKQELQSRYDKGLSQLKLAVTDNPVPDDWIRDLESAFKYDNLPVVNEMLDELDNAAVERRRIEPIKIKDIPILQEFAQVQSKIFDGIKQASSRKGVWHLVTDGGAEFGLTFDHPPAAFKKATEAFLQWDNSKPQPNMDKNLYDKLGAVLSILGIEMSDAQYQGTMKSRLGYKTSIGFSSLRITINPSPSTRPFTLFGSRVAGGGQLPIIIAHKQWTPENLEELMASYGVHQEALLISAVPLTKQQRNAFALHFKRQQLTVLHVDLTMLIFLASQIEDSAENTAVRNFLWLSAPYTYFNPYGADSLKPPLPEMRYGRERQINSLMKMENGSAIVFGGRQLGKSTILQEVQLRFHDPLHNNFSFYEMLDKDLHRRIDLSREAHDKAHHTIWGFLYRHLKQAKLISNASSTLTIDEIMDAVKRTIIDKKNCSFIAIFDEIDPILNVDSAYDFSIFRGLRDLIAHRDVAGRFKVIIGGLENVKRFKDSPNYPLTQMGGSTQISIMPTQEALQLVMEPMLAAGYRFASGQVANRILAITNRHPGLIHIFCHQLINFLCNNRSFSIGNGFVSDEDVASVGCNKDVVELIRDRFDLTLNLDKRYLVIVYGIIADGRGAQAFDVAYAKEIAEIWLPEAFGQLSHRQFAAFLDELEGLGVLRKNNDGRYALRNTNVLKLLADVQVDDVGHKLERAIKDYINYDPMDRHAFDSDRHQVPSPITYRDEKSILGIPDDTSESRDELIVEDINPKQFTTTLVVGSEAQGLKSLQDTLPSLYEEEMGWSTNVTATWRTAYKLFTGETANYRSAADFETRLLKPLLEKRASEAPQMVLITVSLDTEVVDLLAMIDAAHQRSRAPFASHYPVRLLFLLDPAVYWNWLQNNTLTNSRESLQAFIKLGNWSTGAVRALLERLGMIDSSTAIDEVMSRTQGWHYSLSTMTQLHRRHPDWTDISQFKNLTSLTDLDRKHTTKFLNLCGVKSVDWAEPLLVELSEYSELEFDRDVIELLADEAALDHKTLGGLKSMIRWLLDMGILLAKRKVDGTATVYRLAPAIQYALKMCNTHESV